MNEQEQGSATYVHSIKKAQHFLGKNVLRTIQTEYITVWTANEEHRRTQIFVLPQKDRHSSRYLIK